MSEIETARGKNLLLRFEGKKCIHSRQCVLSRPDVFVPNVVGEWIHPDQATPDEIVALAMSCPSGAVTCERTDGGVGERAPLVNVARVRENGPIALHADLRIAGEPDAFRATLCRCGASKNKPYCDASHNDVGFTATGEPSSLASNPLAARDGALTIMPIPDGPLVVRGNLEVVSGTGRTVNRTTGTALCRCGHSSMKPYCDGSHTKVGFKSE